MYKHISIFIFVTAIVAASIVVPSAVAQEEIAEPGDGMRDCISLRSVRRTEVIDDLNILFHMRGRTVYHNILPRACSSLARQDRFSYTTTIGQLCRQDLIRVLYNDTFGLREGNACQLGAFHKITKEDAKALKEVSDQPPRSNPLPMPAPEEIGSEEQDSEKEPL